MIKRTKKFIIFPTPTLISNSYTLHNNKNCIPWNLIRINLFTWVSLCFFCINDVSCKYERSICVSALTPTLGRLTFLSGIVSSSNHSAPPVLSHSYTQTHRLTKRASVGLVVAFAPFGRVNDRPHLYAHAILPEYAALMCRGWPRKILLNLTFYVTFEATLFPFCFDHES